MLATDYDKSTLEHLPRIIIEAVDHDDQRYETCGDWYYTVDGDLVIKVSKTKLKYEFLVALHEMVEALLCNFKGVKEEDVTAFDEDFESMREQYPHLIKDKEPGDEEVAPYHHEHQMASRIEHWIADSCGVDWPEYEKTINNLSKF